MAAFKVGDVVRLKSGGPKMTVVEAKEDDSIECQWFASNEPKHETFRAETLKDAPPPPFTPWS